MKLKGFLCTRDYKLVIIITKKKNINQTNLMNYDTIEKDFE